jgi:ABC-type bacteriocin/lantibiotic exporter with double-glycine peptidase domain
MKQVVIQQREYTCGPCALLNVLRLKNDSSYTEDELAVRCNAKPGTGTDEKDLVRTAKEIGLKVIEEKEGATLSDIERHLDDGAYVIVCYMHAFAGEGHYGVITRYDDRAYYLVDSSFGQFRLRKEYLDKWWYGSDGEQHWYVALK